MTPWLVLAACSAPDPAPDVEAPWPDWTYSHWVWEDESTQESAIALVDDYLAHDIDVGAIIIDSPWATGYNTFEWDPKRFPDPEAMIAHFHSLDVRVMLWIVPAINTDVEPLYGEGADAGYFMQRGADQGPAVLDWWKGEGSLIDYFNPDAVSWWHGLVDRSLAYDIDGWKCDGLDYSVLLASYSAGASKHVDRLDYSHAYYRDFFDTTRAALGDDRIITARPVDNYGFGLGGDDVAFAPTDINWAGWVGDQDASFAGLRAALDNLYESSIMGYVGMGSDIGGYRTDDSKLGRTKELFIRWAQQGALSPVMENGGGGEHRPWMFDEQTTDIYRTYTRLHYALMEYLDTQGGIALSENRSLMNFSDEQTYTYQLGPDVFVAPVLEEGGAVEFDLPSEGTWRYLFGDQSYESSARVQMTVPLEEFPIFLREGSEIESLLLAVVTQG